MNNVTIDRARRMLVIEPRGLNKLWGFVRRLEVSISQVRGATHDPGAAEGYKGVRAPGLGIPGHKWVGTWRKDGERHYWNVAGGRDVVVVEVSTPRFQRLYLSVDEPRKIVDDINAVVAEQG